MWILGIGCKYLDLFLCLVYQKEHYTHKFDFIKMIIYILAKQYDIVFSGLKAPVHVGDDSAEKKTSLYFYSMI